MKIISKSPSAEEVLAVISTNFKVRCGVLRWRAKNPQRAGWLEARGSGRGQLTLHMSVTTPDHARAVSLWGSSGAHQAALTV